MKENAEGARAEAALAEVEGREKEAQGRVAELRAKVESRRGAIAGVEAKLARLRADRGKLLVAAADGDRAAHQSAARGREALIVGEIDVADARAIAEETQAQLAEAEHALRACSMAVLLARMTIGRLTRAEAAAKVDEALEVLAVTLKGYRDAALGHGRDVVAAGFKAPPEVDDAIAGLVNWRLVRLLRDGAVPNVGRDWFSNYGGVSLAGFEARLQLEGYELKGRAAAEPEVPVLPPAA